MADLAPEVEARDGVTLQLRVGLNSGQVIAGEIGSGSASYTAIGEQVGMAQRMESVAPPGAVMVSDSTARLVEHVAVLGRARTCAHQGRRPASACAPAAGLCGPRRHHPRRRGESQAGGTHLGTQHRRRRSWTRPSAGQAASSTSWGRPASARAAWSARPPRVAASRGVPIFAAYCESHSSDIAFHVVARLLRAALGIEDVDADKARTRVTELIPRSRPGRPCAPARPAGRSRRPCRPTLPPDARRRRVTALINGAALARRAAGRLRHRGRALDRRGQRVRCWPSSCAPSRRRRRWS